MFRDFVYSFKIYFRRENWGEWDRWRLGFLGFWDFGVEWKELI